MWSDALRASIAPVVSTGARLATWRMRSRRGAVTDAVSPVSGDILVYLANGDPIRRFIRETIESAAPPVHVLAHSLGGIACVDLCVLDPPRGIETLVTVGSQAPYLYELGALPSLRPPAQLPRNFPTWINVHDPNDMLSYVGSSVFPGQVHDIEVRSRMPFPYSHSAYWKSPVLWAALAKRLA
jgi:pimeloyl-ACP methyl ester carboxylesterase